MITGVPNGASIIVNDESFSIGDANPKSVLRVQASLGLIYVLDGRLLVNVPNGSVGLLVDLSFSVGASVEYTILLVASGEIGRAHV